MYGNVPLIVLLTKMIHARHKFWESMSTLTFDLVSAAPSGNGFQRVTTKGPVVGSLSIEGDLAYVVIPKDGITFLNNSSHGPVPLSPNVVGCLNIKTQYGYTNYNVNYVCLQEKGTEYLLFMRVYVENTALQSLQFRPNFAKYRL